MCPDTPEIRYRLYRKGVFNKYIINFLKGNSLLFDLQQSRFVFKSYPTKPPQAQAVEFQIYS